MLNCLYSLQALKLSHSTVGQISIGHIVNLASNDVQRFDLVSRDTVAVTTSHNYILLQIVKVKLHVCFHRHFEISVHAKFIQ